jgi:hypothetical protein
MYHHPFSRRFNMRYIAILVLLTVASMAHAQLTVSATSPANGATSVSTTTILSITFSAAIDTLRFSPDNSFITSVDSVTGMYWSGDRRTVYFPAVLKPNSAYFIVIYYAPGAGGEKFPIPQEVHFTTGSTFPSNLYSVSGTISGGGTGVSPANALVAMSVSGLAGKNGPVTIAGSVADGAGNFTIPYVPIGSWIPITAKDANGDGQIDPSKGDVLGEGSSVSVTTANVTGVSLAFLYYPPVLFKDARDTALARAAATLPPTRELRKVAAYETDSLGRASEWEFYYTVPGTPGVTRIRPGMFGTDVQTQVGMWDWAVWGKPIPNVLQAALADSFVAKVERAGGKAFRLAKPAGDTVVFREEVTIGDLKYSQFYQLVTDTTKFYWGAEYKYEKPITQGSSVLLGHKLFLGDYATGDVLTVAGLDERTDWEVPQGFALSQNYPNPFNPTTAISYSIRAGGWVSLKVYDVLGREVAELVNEYKPAGSYRVSFEGSTLSSGLYLYRLQSGNQIMTRKMMLMK